MQIKPLFLRHFGQRFKLCFMMACLGTSSLAFGYTELRIEDRGTSSYNHVYQPGTRFKVDLYFSTDQSCYVQTQWKNARGVALGQPVRLQKNTATTLTSVPGVTGYLGLVITSDCAELREAEGFAGGRREVGFAILPHRSAATRWPDPKSPFGMVHARQNDPYLGTWMKTLTWRTTPPRFWPEEIEQRRANGMLELPIVAGQDWQSEDFMPISQTQLGALASRIEAFFRVSPSLAFWELGIEENLTRNYNKEYYWENLAAKAKVVRETMQRVAPGSRLIYQIATTSAEHVEPFAQSEAAKYFDILSLHPYKWPDFPDPEGWLGELIDHSRSILRANDVDMPIWFTEVGAPHHGSAPGKFFGYPVEARAVRGKQRSDAMDYMIKLHVIALSKGVEKIFWYNYQDRHVGNDYAENFFGLVDYWGYPKPVYAAYARLVMCLQKPRAKSEINLDNKILGYRFDTAGGEVMVAWNTASQRKTEMSISRLGVDERKRFQILDLQGQPLPVEDGKLELTGSPVFIAQGDAIKQCQGGRLKSPVRREIPSF